MSSLTISLLDTTGERTRLLGEIQPLRQNEQQPHRLYSVVQQAGEPRQIRRDEFFPTFPPYDVLLSSPHRHYLTTANHAYKALQLKRSTSLNVQTDVKEPLHRALQEIMWAEVPAPTFWIGLDKVRNKHHTIRDTETTFAIGKNRDKCYTMVQASAAGIIDENRRNGHKNKSPQGNGIVPPRTEENQQDSPQGVQDGTTSTASYTMDSLDLQALADAVLPMSVSSASGQRSDGRYGMA